MWIVLLSGSLACGIACAFLLSGRVGLWASGAIPWNGLLCWQLYHEYVLPYEGGGASISPVAQLFAGTIGALAGMGAYYWFMRFARRII